MGNVEVRKRCGLTGGGEVAHNRKRSMAMRCNNASYSQAATLCILQNKNAGTHIMDVSNSLHNEKNKSRRNKQPRNAAQDPVASADGTFRLVKEVRLEVLWMSEGWFS